MKLALQPFSRQKTILLTSYRGDGTAVATPVSIAFEGDHAFFRTWDTAGKAKRLRSNPTSRSPRPPSGASRPVRRSAREPAS